MIFLASYIMLLMIYQVRHHGHRCRPCRQPHHQCHQHHLGRRHLRLHPRRHRRHLLLRLLLGLQSCRHHCHQRHQRRRPSRWLINSIGASDMATPAAAFRKLASCYISLMGKRTSIDPGFHAPLHGASALQTGLLPPSSAGKFQRFSTQSMADSSFDHSTPMFCAHGTRMAARCR